MFSSVNGYVAVDFMFFFPFVYYIVCLLIAKCRLQSHIYIYVIVIFYYLHKTYIQNRSFVFIKIPGVVFQQQRAADQSWAPGRTRAHRGFLWICSKSLCNRGSFKSRGCVHELTAVFHLRRSLLTLHSVTLFAFLCNRSIKLCNPNTESVFSFPLFPLKWALSYKRNQFYLVNYHLRI